MDLVEVEDDVEYWRVRVRDEVSKANMVGEGREAI